MRNVYNFLLCVFAEFVDLCLILKGEAKTAKTKSNEEDSSIGDLIGRTGLAKRWKCHTETVRRKEKLGLLHPL